ncbi:hypothetical protein [Mechercharimyces sp. CAU 1602]|uniref:hypothetical protein n=1 Tax=Mechercharimyces sp. CAU 1602 TaxID=2973933 RepID=UPI002162C827|nr:hypothetical protein [Mechercharimyces sp. CAU 1602]MCS1352822.1 hypothetical protein [Mechercharimyces sp. CAU 1602]
MGFGFAIQHLEGYNEQAIGHYYEEQYLDAMERGKSPHEAYELAELMVYINLHQFKEGNQ